MLRQASTFCRFARIARDFTNSPMKSAIRRESGIREGLLTLFCRHTSASLLIQENAAPAARRDLEAYFARLAPEGGPYEHDDEGPDDMPAHLRSALTATQLSIPVAGRPARCSAPGRAFSCSNIAATRPSARSRCTWSANEPRIRSRLARGERARSAADRSRGEHGDRRHRRQGARRRAGPHREDPRGPRRRPSVPARHARQCAARQPQVQG